MGHVANQSISRIMSPETPHPLTGNQFAAKAVEDKLSESRSLRFKASEIKGYNRAKPADMPLRIWIRQTLNKEAGLPPPLTGE